MDKENANPTILNASDLPSRRVETAEKQQQSGLFDVVPAYGYLSDRFSEAQSSSSDSEDDTPEDIDEQEIYGMPPLPTCFLACRSRNADRDDPETQSAEQF